MQDFYEPCLEQSIAYDRAVAYFSSSVLVVAAQGLTAFIRGGGRMRLVTSPKLSEADIEAIEQGIQQREEAIARALLRSIESAAMPPFTFTDCRCG